MEGLESVENIEAFSLFGEPLYKTPITLWLPSEKEAYERKLREHNIFTRTISVTEPVGVRLSIGFWNRESDLDAITEAVSALAA